MLMKLLSNGEIVETIDGYDNLPRKGDWVRTIDNRRYKVENVEHSIHIAGNACKMRNVILWVKQVK